jgi:hypothetical protein
MGIFGEVVRTSKFVIERVELADIGIGVRNLKPKTGIPKPETRKRNPKHETRNTKHEAYNSKSESRNPESEIIFGVHRM